MNGGNNSFTWSHRRMQEIYIERDRNLVRTFQVFHFYYIFPYSIKL